MDIEIAPDAIVGVADSVASLVAPDAAVEEAPPLARPSLLPCPELGAGYLVDAFSPGERRVLAGFVSACVACTSYFWYWWLAHPHSPTLTTTLLTSGLLGVGSFALPAWFLFWIWRARRPDPNLVVPPLRVAMIVTKAPSEPWPLVRMTLKAMLEQDVPFAYDTWLADEQPDRKAKRWCRKWGVRISTRQGDPGYHRSEWPRRTRCKEGNLAYFYDHWGYDHYDVVSQLDADHVPTPDYLRHIVAPFADPRVGYVAAPSICDRNAARSWSARGRLHAEAVLHGATQAGANGGYAPSCIGSHYAVRTRALKQIGGLGPELAEDFTTTLMMSAGRWEGVFALDAEAHGDGPRCFADCITQELQWSRSMTNIMLRITPGYWSRLTPRAKLRLGFCQLWYPLCALLMISTVVLPVYALVSKHPYATVGLGDFFGHLQVPVLAMVATVIWLRRQRLLRPLDAPALSWELVLFQLIRWPWVMIGCAQGLFGWIVGRRFEFRVTPKGECARPLPVRVLLPYLIVAAIAAAPLALQRTAGAAHGYFLLTLINAAVYAAIVPVLIALHAGEAGRSASTGRRATLAPCAVAILGGALVVGAAGIHFGALRAAPRYVSAFPVVHYPLATVDLGVTTDALAENETWPWTPSQLTQVNSFERDISKHVSIVMWFADWAHSRPELAQLDAIAARGSTPEITWEPWDYSKGLLKPQAKYSLASIVAGRHDAYIRSWAQTLKRFGLPVRLRFAQEMNGNWYPWSEGLYGNRPGEYVLAWRHIHDIFTAVGAINVEWAWTPVAAGGRPFELSEYPGNQYVDIVGLSGFNGGGSLAWGGWQTPRNIYRRSLRELEHLAPGRPVELSEVGSTERGGSKADWISQLFALARSDRAISAVIWFNVSKEADWPIESSAAATRAFATAVQDPRYR